MQIQSARDVVVSGILASSDVGGNMAVLAPGLIQGRISIMSLRLEKTFKISKSNLCPLIESQDH